MYLRKIVKHLFHHETIKGNIYLIYLLYISIIIFCSFLFAYIFSNNFNVINRHNEIILENITFEFGELIRNMYDNKGYFHTVNDVKYYLTKLPVVPLLLWSISKISLNYFFIIILKNVIIFSIYFYFLYKLLGKFNNNYFFLLILFVPILIPYNLSVSLNYVYEDNIISIFLPLLFLSLISDNNNRFYYTSLILFILYFTKTSMFLLTLIVPLVIIFTENKVIFVKKIIPLIVVIVSILIWGLFGFSKTGKFPFGSSGASNNSYVLSYALNKEFRNYYPDKSTDLIPIESLNYKFNTEWERYDYYKIKNQEYLKNNFSRFLVDCGIKIKFILFGVKKDGVLPNENNEYNNDLRYSSIINKIFLNISIIMLIFNLIINIKNKYLSKDNLYFFVILVFNLLPHVIAWATSKHLVAITNISIIYLIVVLNKKHKY